MTSSRTPGQRAGLTQAQVLSAARSLLADQGFVALTMRALAERLGVVPNTLYSYVASKDALIDDVLDDVLAEVRTPDVDSEDPRRGLEIVMASTYDVLLANRELVPIYLARQGARGPNAQHLGEVIITLLGRTGVTGRPAREALRVLVVFTIGFAAFTSGGPLGPDDASAGDAELAENFDRGLGWLLAAITESG